jgi:glycolate oxidase
MLEFMDKASINAVEDLTKMGLDRDAEAMLVLQTDEPAGHAETEIAEFTTWCTANHAAEIFSTTDKEEGEAFVVARRLAIPALEQKGSLLLEDVGVPVPELGSLVRGIEAIATARDVIIAVVAHAGDGNTHPLIVFDPSDPDESDRARLAYGEVMELAMSLGGTITGEHGVGRLKKAWLGDYLGADALELNLRIKHALDPQGLFNPGAVY